MTVALCLPGGGSRGYSTVGYLKALTDLGIHFDFISGTSVGAINGAIFHQEGNTELLEKLWYDIKASDIYSINLLGAVNPLTKKRAILSSAPLRRTIEKYLDFNKVKDNIKPCYVNTTDYTNWRPLTLNIQEMELKDEMVNFILASASIPMVFDPVKWGNSWLYDGGMVMNTSVQDCIRRGATKIIVLRPVLPQKGKPINSIIDVFSLSMSIPQEYVMDRELVTVDLINSVQEASPNLHHVEVIVVQPLVPPSWDILDFSFGGKARKQILSDAYNLAFPILQRAFR